MSKKFIQVLVCTVLLTACSKPIVQEQGVRTVKATSVLSLGLIEKSFSGVVTPDQFSDLAFKMSGPLVALKVDEGEKVKTGQVIAEIDPLDFKLELEAKRASYKTAQASMDRATKLLAKEAISRQEFETTQASFSNAKAAFEYAVNMVEQTKLRAPFNGFIQKKYVENYQKVQAGQGIVSLINPSKLLVQFTMPESNIMYLNSENTLKVEFDNYKGKWFNAKVKDYVEASLDGSGIPVMLYIDDKDFDLSKYKISVGFSCHIALNADNETQKSATLIPLSAIVSDSTTGDMYVFVIDKQTKKVAQRVIKEDGFVGRDQVIVSNGLTAGEQIVVAGATRLVDGQQVKVLTD